ncbi:DUF6157 family protein [Heyndrickxia sp. FSL W8-0496]|nr:hypothetical protein J19TS1_40900 [Heyndrickxia oleronia]
MSYKNTFIAVSEDSKVTTAIKPLPKEGRPTIASIEYDLISMNPYKFTEQDIQFKTYLIKNNIESNSLDTLREEFSSKPMACFRASPLVKKYGWGIHYDEQGKVAVYAVDSKSYKDMMKSNKVTILKGMRSKKL